MTRMLIGGPTAYRSWVLDRWYEHAIKAAEKSGVDFGFVLAVPKEDTSTIDVVAQFSDYETSVIVLDEPPPPENIIRGKGRSQRSWTPKRYEHMAFLRNTVLEYVRTQSPDYFLSVDSDILMHEDTISRMLEVMDEYEFDALSSKVFLSPYSDQGKGHRRYPNYGLNKRNGFIRGNRDGSDITGTFKVDILMALKLMNPKAYSIDYWGSHHGEDIGWSRNCKEAGVVLGFDGMIANKHIMDKDLIDVVDNRVGY